MKEKQFHSFNHSVVNSYAKSDISHMDIQILDMGKPSRIFCQVTCLSLPVPFIVW